MLPLTRCSIAALPRPLAWRAPLVRAVTRLPLPLASSAALVGIRLQLLNPSQATARHRHTRAQCTSRMPVGRRAPLGAH